MPPRLIVVGIVWAALIFAPGTDAQTAADYAVQVSAVAQASPARIALSWPGDPKATQYTVSRKSREAGSWGAPKLLGATATNYIDANVSAGNAYEYRIVKTAPVGTSNYTAHGYVFAGINAPLADNRGKLLLLVESGVAPAFDLQLSRLQLDLAGDGWTLERRDVSRSQSPSSVRDLVLSIYRADPTRLKALFLLGHVPVPYSGNYGPDGHDEHRGAWPADAFYADLDAEWTDTVVSNTAAASRSRNVPGDGKYDQSYIPTDVELQMGRVDLSDLPAFVLTEAELLKRYLEKNHHFRHGYVRTQERAVIDDHFGAFHGEAFAANGWRAFAPMFGPGNATAGDWLATLQTESRLCGYGCGSGTYTSAGGVVSTEQLAGTDPQVVFAFLFGSYFGDWDSRDNLLRATIATPGYTLASAWAGRPYWILHHAALGEPIGSCAQVTQNNWTLYSSNLMPSTVHIALMGDPTLRLHPVAPPRALTVRSNALSGVDLQWQPPGESNILGYHVYRAASPAGPFTRLTPNVLTSTTHRSSYRTGVFMVRAVKLQQSASGSYYNASQGIMQSPDGSVGRPAIEWLSVPSEAVYLLPNSIPLAASVLSAANNITNVGFYANGALVAQAQTPPYRTTWTDPPVGVFEVVARAFSGEGIVTNSNPITVRVDHGGTPLLEIAPNDEGGFTLRGREAFGRSYIVEYAESLPATNWHVLTIITNPIPGTFEATDLQKEAQRYYRTRLQP